MPVVEGSKNKAGGGRGRLMVQNKLGNQGLNPMRFADYVKNLGLYLRTMRCCHRGLIAGMKWRYNPISALEILLRLQCRGWIVGGQEFRCKAVIRFL